MAFWRRRAGFCGAFAIPLLFACATESILRLDAV